MFRGKVRSEAKNKSEFLDLREARSKSFGCEKELYIKVGEKRSKKTRVRRRQKIEKEKVTPVKPSFLEQNLNYIDDETSIDGEAPAAAKLSDEDDYDDNVIYEGNQNFSTDKIFENSV